MRKLSKGNPFGNEPLTEMSVSSIRLLFNLLPDIYFFAKDHDGRFIMANQSFAELCGVNSEAEVLGKTDWDVFPADRASLYVQDDRRVIQTGSSMVNRIEPAPSPLAGPRRVITSKVALLNADGRIVGVAGIARDLNRAETALRTYSQFEKAIAHIEEHYGETLSIEELAREENMSVSRFERRFKEAFQITPSTYILQIRTRHACRMLLHSNRPIVGIALDCGFYDHSHFTHHFRKALGTTPLRYRKTHQNPTREIR